LQRDRKEVGYRRLVWPGIFLGLSSIYKQGGKLRHVIDNVEEVLIGDLTAHLVRHLVRHLVIQLDIQLQIQLYIQSQIQLEI
jgi:hypothetical protein